MSSFNPSYRWNYSEILCMASCSATTLSVSILLIAGITLKYKGDTYMYSTTLCFNPSYRWNYSEMNLAGYILNFNVLFQSFLSLELL